MAVAMEENSFFEYLDSTGGEADLRTKSELLAEVRAEGYKLSDRALSYYTSAGLVPRSARIGSRGPKVYPAILTELITWILQTIEEGASIEALRELLPVWKYLVRARSEKSLDLGALEYVARQYVTSPEAVIGVPRVVNRVMVSCCPNCQNKIMIVYKDGQQKALTDPTVTIGFSLVRVRQDDDNQEPTPEWFTSTRITLGGVASPNTDPTTVILGRKPNESLPPDPRRVTNHEQDSPQQPASEEVDS